MVMTVFYYTIPYNSNITIIIITCIIIIIIIAIIIITLITIQHKQLRSFVRNRRTTIHPRVLVPE